MREPANDNVCPSPTELRRVPSAKPFQPLAPAKFFSVEPFRHLLDAASGSRPHLKKPADPHECCKVQEADTSISFAQGAPPIIGIDTEYVQDPEAGDKRNRILSYQFAVITSEAAWRGIVYCRDNERLTLSGLIGHALELGVRNKCLKIWPKQVIVAAHHTDRKSVV